MKRLLLFLILLSCSFAGFAKHLKGGFFTYKYLGQTGNEIRYKVTLTVYMECSATGGQIDQTIPFTFFKKGISIYEKKVDVSISNQFTLNKTEDDECITGDQTGCYYKIVIYELADVTLPINPNGYTVSYQRCCRIDGINNLSNSGEIGNTYSVDIPGTMTAANAETNSSASFLTNDVVVVCGNSALNYPFTATD